MVRAQFYLISIVVAAIYLLTIAVLITPPTPQAYDQTPQIFDNIQREIEIIVQTSPNPQNELQAFDSFLQGQLSELNYDYTLTYDSSLTKFSLSISSGQTKIKNDFEVVK